MMKLLRSIAFLFIGVLILNGFAFAGGKKEGTAEEKPITLKLATYNTANTYRGAGEQLLKEEIEKHTNGKIKIEIYWQETLLKSKEILDGVKNGVVDMGIVNPSYYPKKLPLNSGFLLYTYGPDEMMKKIDVSNDIYKKYPEFNKEFDNQNQKILFKNFPQPLDLISTVPVNNLEEMKSYKIRASNPTWLKLLEDAGAIPVSVPWGDCYMALETGTVDGVFTNIDGITSTKLYEPAPYSFTSSKWCIMLPYFYTINLNTWNKLPSTVQEQILAAAEVATKRMAELYDNEYQNVIDKQKAEGTTVVMASDDDINKWTNLSIMPTLEKEYADEAEKNGIADGKELVNYINSLLK